MKVVYSDDVVVRWLNRYNCFITEKEFRVTYYIKPGRKAIVFTIPAGFTTDLASIPRWATPIVPKLGHHLQPAVAHDWCYENKIPGLSRETADMMFYQGMLCQGVRKTRAMLMYRAVRLGGRGLWG